MRVIPLLYGVLVPMALGNPSPAWREATEAISAQMTRACDTFDDADDTTAEARAELCACLGGGAPCSPGGDLDRWARHLRATLAAEPVEAAATPECLDRLRTVAVGRLYQVLAGVCESDPGRARRLAAFRGVSTPPSRCWRFTGMTEDGCLEAKACTATGARLADLGVPSAATARGAVVCESRLQRTHAQRDPERRNTVYQRPLTQGHLDHAAYRHGEGTYAQMNCHGTALGLAGNFLDAVPVTRWRVVPAYEAQCGPLTRARYDGARGDRPHPTIGELSLSHGVAINMRYDDCSPDDCGEATMWTNWCHQGLISYTLIDGMCVSCWGRHLERLGYRALPSDTHWRGLHAGCVLNQNDHTVTLTGVFEGMCYFYEATNPGGPSQLRARACPEMVGRFPRIWCPRSATAFTLESVIARPKAEAITQ